MTEKRTDYRHADMLKKKLGAKEARRFWHECEIGFPCAFCSAMPGDPCTTRDGIHVPYVHRDRRSAAHDFTHDAIWDITNAAVEEAAEARAAATAAMVQQRGRVRIFVDPEEVDALRAEVRVLRRAVEALTAKVAEVLDDA